ncbi:MAG: Ig-like domain-containing protein [Butyrivibrio sp.]|nr:Ig-like domain-containing protein [Butyrivibrio sp.]
MKKFSIIVFCIIAALALPLRVSAAGTWSGSGVYIPTQFGKMWNVAQESIEKAENPGSVYEITDLYKYSAYLSNDYSYEGNYIENSFHWHNKSRLAYVKLIQVGKGQKLSFVFSGEYYVYCAEYDSSFKLIKAGDWNTTGDVLQLNKNTEWIMLVFRQVNGDLESGAGQDTELSVEAIQNSPLRYLILSPFTYSFDMNGGSYNGKSSYKAERWGVEKMNLPVPVKAGYTFEGWRLENGGTYDGTLPVRYDKELFKDCKFTAVWRENQAGEVKLDKPYLILEQNSKEKTKLTASVLPEETVNKSVSWSSSDTKIAEVSADGVVTAKNTGVAEIKAEALGGASAVCKVYVMGFEVSVPAYCTLNEAYAIKINIYNNGTPQMSGRKSVIVDTEDTVELVRAGDADVKYSVLAEASSNYNSGFKKLQSTGYLANTKESATVYYRLKPSATMERAGDYTGSVTFSVSVL